MQAYFIHIKERIRDEIEASTSIFEMEQVSVRVNMQLKSLISNFKRDDDDDDSGSRSGSRSGSTASSAASRLDTRIIIENELNELRLYVNECIYEKNRQLEYSTFIRLYD